jgi:hypothetical protein
VVGREALAKFSECTCASPSSTPSHTPLSLDRRLQNIGFGWIVARYIRSQSRWFRGSPAEKAAVTWESTFTSIYGRDPFYWFDDDVEVSEEEEGEGEEEEDCGVEFDAYSSNDDDKLYAHCVPPGDSRRLISGYHIPESWSVTTCEDSILFLCKNKTRNVSFLTRRETLEYIKEHTPDELEI